LPKVFSKRKKTSFVHPVISAIKIVCYQLHAKDRVKLSAQCCEMILGIIVLSRAAKGRRELAIQ